MSKTRQQHRIGLIIFVTAAAATCLALGYWQLSRFESATGTAQNLGYALQWPAFAAFFIYAYRRFIRLEADLEAELESDDSPADSAPAGELAAPKPKKKRVWVDRDKSQMTEIPEYLLPKRAAPGHDGQPGTGLTAAATVSHGAISDAAVDATATEYNNYLAQLNERDTEGRRR